MAKAIGLSILFSLFFLSVSAQLEMVDKEIDLGILRRADQNWADFEIRNLDSKNAVIFRVVGPKNTDIKLSSKMVSSGASEFIRVAVSPKAEGKFEIELEVYASAWLKPQIIALRGESTYAASSLIPCPEFGSSQASANNEFHFSVRELLANIPIDEAEILVYRDGREFKKLATNEHGEVSAQLPYGRYFFSIKHNSSQFDTALYVNAINSHLLAMLDGEQIFRDEEVEVEELQKEELARVESRQILINPKPTQPVSPPVTEQADISFKAVITNLDKENPVLPMSRFKENNLVFLVDISTSMKKDGKLDLLKIAMIELLDVLRSIDRFSLISYSSETNILIETESNLNREACIAAILALEPGGSTEGARAIDKAGRVALSHFVENGNNQIILATDGAFNEGVNKALSYASRYNRKDVNLSVLGIKCGPFTTKQMRELVNEGGGRYVPINSPGDAGNQLIEEIKKSSAR